MLWMMSLYCTRLTSSLTDLQCPCLNPSSSDVCQPTTEILADCNPAMHCNFNPFFQSESLSHSIGSVVSPGFQWLRKGAPSFWGQRWQMGLWQVRLDRSNHGNKAWTCQLWKPEDTLFVLYHYSAMDMPAGNTCYHTVNCKTTKTVTDRPEWYWIKLESIYLCWVQNSFHYFFNMKHISGSSITAYWLTILETGHWISLINVLKSSNIYDHPLLWLIYSRAIRHALVSEVYLT